MTSRSNLDMDAIIACTDLVGRSGAAELEIGYLHDDVPIEKAGWYATALYKGAKLIAENQPSQEAACDALARRILDGGRCTHCHRTVTLNEEVPGCRWRRMGPRWERSCGGKNRAQRRRERRG